MRGFSSRPVYPAKPNWVSFLAAWATIFGIVALAIGFAFIIGLLTSSR